LHCIICHLPAFTPRKYKNFDIWPLYLYISFIYYILSTFKSVAKNFFTFLRRILWVNRDVVAKWAAKKDMPAGKYGIKSLVKRYLPKISRTESHCAVF